MKVYIFRKLPDFYSRKEKYFVVCKTHETTLYSVGKKPECLESFHFPKEDFLNWKKEGLVIWEGWLPKSRICIDLVLLYVLDRDTSSYYEEFWEKRFNHLRGFFNFKLNWWLYMHSYNSLRMFLFGKYI